MAVARAQWRTPSEEPQVIHPEERLCYQVLQGRERFQYFHPATPLPGEAPADDRSSCGWQTCLSSGVYRQARCIGALCLRFPAKYALTEECRFVVDLITQSLEREEALNGMQEDLAARLRYEIGLAQFASTLIKAPKTEDTLSTALQQLPDATEASHLYLFTNFTDPVDGLCCRQTHEVCRFGVTAQLSNPLLQHVPYSAIPLFHQELAQRRTVNRIVAQLPTAEHEILQSQDVLSILMIPIFVHDVWRGLMGLDDTRQEREWSEQEVRLLQTAAEIYQLYRQRQDQDAALRESETRHRNLYRPMRLVCDNTQDMIWAKDIQRNYLFANQAICKQLLITVDPDEAVGKSDLFFAERQIHAHPDDPNWMTFGATYRASDAMTMHEARSLRNEESGYVCGQWRVLDVVKSPLLDEQGQLIGTVGCARDITEAKQSQLEREADRQQLFESENLLNLIIEAIPNPVFYKNADFRYERCNQAYANFLGIPKPQLIGALVHDLFPRDLADIYHRADRLLQQTGGQQIYEAQLMHADGSRHDVIFYKSLILNADGALRGIVGVVVDITQHKQTEVQLRRIAETDTLTQTYNYNRAYFYGHGTRVRPGTALSAAFVVDHAGSGSLQDD
ncbi:MAG: PAS domain-containing protein [Candidatus Competibacteraceae bacterium]|nr:PAS domain-containing protein [Candidatus Competibacteraceae bacterium]MCB1821716.1 PAS domain-containing protein [Candidatus Competibacteraceae bacterium]